MPPATMQWLLVAAGFGCCMAMAMPQVQMVAYCMDLGYGIVAGAEMVSIMLAGGIISRLLSGFVADYIGGIRTLLIGSLAIRADAGKCANRSYLIRPDGEVAARYDKIHMFDVQLNAGNIYRESDSYAAGGAAIVADVPAAKLGMSVCYDVRFPELFRQLAMAGAQIIAVPAAFTRITGEAHWHILLRARAIETGCFVIAPAQAGKHQDGRETYGHSLIIDPWGEILAEGGTEPGVISATLDLAKVDEVRGKIPSLSHVRPFRAPA